MGEYCESGKGVTYIGDLLALYLSGTYCCKTGTGPPRCQLPENRLYIMALQGSAKIVDRIRGSSEDFFVKKGVKHCSPFLSTFLYSLGELSRRVKYLLLKGVFSGGGGEVKNKRPQTAKKDSYNPDHSLMLIICKSSFFVGGHIKK